MSSRQYNYDLASNVPLWSASSVRLAPTQANINNLYQNNTANDFTTGATIGVYGVDSNEIIVEGSKAAGTGWVLRTTGSGGRAGRVTEETLSVVASFRTDNNADDTIYPDASVSITTQPISLNRVVIGAGNTATYSVAVNYAPTGSTVSYVWQVNNNAGGAWVNVATQPSGATWTGNTSATLVLTPSTTAANNYVFRAVVTVTPPAGITNATAVTATSSNGRIIITS